MIVSHQHRFIFIKSTKTAGTSVEMALSRFCGPKDVITAIEEVDEEVRLAQGGMGPQNDILPMRCYQARDWRCFLKGQRPRIRSHTPAVLARKILGEEVWNSYFKFSIERNPYDKAISRYFWGIKRMEPKPTLAEFMQQVPARKLSNWPIYGKGDQLAVDFMIRFENLSQDLETVMLRLGLPEPLVLPVSKGGYRKDKRDYHELLDEKSRAQVERICARELKEFGYQW